MELTQTMNRLTLNVVKLIQLKEERFYWRYIECFFFVTYYDVDKNLDWYYWDSELYRKTEDDKIYLLMEYYRLKIVEIEDEMLHSLLFPKDYDDDNHMLVLDMNDWLHSYYNLNNIYIYTHMLWPKLEF